MNALPFKLIHPDAKVPTRGSNCAAGLDLYSLFGEFFEPGETRAIGVGVCVAIPDGFYGQIATRSSMARRGLFAVGGVIDSDYRGELVVCLHNSGPSATFAKGDRIAQLLIIPVPAFVPTSDPAFWPVQETDRGTGGFGSTGA